MQEPKMARVDITLNVSDKGGRIKKGKYTYTIASQDFPKGPAIRSADREKQKKLQDIALLCSA